MAETWHPLSGANKVPPPEYREEETKERMAVIPVAGNESGIEHPSGGG